MATKLAKTFGQEIVEKSATELGGRVVGTEEEGESVLPCLSNDKQHQ